MVWTLIDIRRDLNGGIYYQQKICAYEERVLNHYDAYEYGADPIIGKERSHVTLLCDFMPKDYLEPHEHPSDILSLKIKEYRSCACCYCDERCGCGTVNASCSIHDRAIHGYDKQYFMESCKVNTPEQLSRAYEINKRKGFKKLYAFVKNHETLIAMYQLENPNFLTHYDDSLVPF